VIFPSALFPAHALILDDPSPGPGQAGRGLVGGSDRRLLALWRDGCGLGVGGLTSNREKGDGSNVANLEDLRRRKQCPRTITKHTDLENATKKILGEIPPNAKFLMGEIGLVIRLRHE